MFLGDSGPLCGENFFISAITITVPKTKPSNKKSKTKLKRYMLNQPAMNMIYSNVFNGKGKIASPSNLVRFL